MAEHSTVARSAVRPSEPARQVIATFERDQRDFHSVSGIRPKCYDVVADVEGADRALQLLASGNRKE